MSRRRSARSMGAVILAALVTAVTLIGGALPAAASDTAVASGHVVVVDIAGLQWNDITAGNTPTLYGLARHSSIAALSTTTVQETTCPTDAWVTLGTGARAMHQHDSMAGQAVCSVPPAPTPSGGSTASEPAFAAIQAYNKQFHYNPKFGVLPTTLAKAGGCVTAAGPGAALAAADPNGQVNSYVADPGKLDTAMLSRCQLTLVDLPGLTYLVPWGSHQWEGNQAALALRAHTLHATDARLGALLRQLPSKAMVVVAGMSDSGAKPHLHTVMVHGQAADGTSFDGGWLTSPSTRHDGLIQLTDLTPSVLRWAGVPARDMPTGLVGSQVGMTSAGRPASTGAAMKSLTQQDTADQIFANTNTRFFIDLVLLNAAVVVAAGIAFAVRRRLPRPRPVLLAVSAVTLLLGSVPAASFLANLSRWWQYQHPARVLFGATAVFAVLVAALALLGPWRRHPLGPAGFIGVVTVGVIGFDVMTGSHLQMASPYGLSTLIAGRFYGIGNAAVGTYAGAAMIGTAWLASLPLRWDRAPRLSEAPARQRALLVVLAMALFTVVAMGWPSFGNKFGGTIAVVPGFVAFALIVYGARFTWRKAAIVLASGVVVVAIFSVINWLKPAAARSDTGNFVQSLISGGASDIIQRKIATNIGSLNNDWISHYIPYAVVVLGVLVLIPRLVGARSVVAACRGVPLLRTALILVLLTEVLGWFVDDSGVLVPKDALTLVLPLGVAAIAGSLMARGAEPDAETIGRPHPAVVERNGTAIGVTGQASSSPSTQSADQ